MHLLGGKVGRKFPSFCPTQPFHQANWHSECPIQQWKGLAGSPIPMADKGSRSCRHARLCQGSLPSDTFFDTLRKVSLKCHKRSKRRSCYALIWMPGGQREPAGNSIRDRRGTLGTRAYDLWIIPLLPSEGIFPWNSQ